MKASIKTLGKFIALMGIGLVMTGCKMLHQSPQAAGPKVPFNAMVIRHTVADYAKWKPFFDADEANRTAAGLHVISVVRGIENPNDVEIPMLVDDLAKAKAFGADPRLKEVMTKAGVTGAPEVKFYRTLRFNDPGRCDYVEIVSKVKNFDAWLKVFDSEGPDARKKDGLTDVVLAQGIDDPNVSYLIFKINSVAEAKKAFENPVRRKLMEQAGVGETTFYFGRDQ